VGPGPPQTDQLARETTVAVALLDDRNEIVFDEGACAGADDQFVI
jgi:hypothetical protein